jgi:hypothetical protein
VFDRLVNHHQLNNLIWVWTSTGTPDALNWYPGDDYVDIIGADIYLPAGNYSSSFITFDNMAALYAGKKIVTLSENGPIPDPESLFSEVAVWSWFCTWSGDFILDGVSNTSAHINTVYNHEYVITLDEIDNIDAIAELLQKKREESDDEEETVTGISEDGSQLTFQNPVKNDRLIIKTQNSKIITGISVHNIQGGNEVAQECVSLRGMEAEVDFTSKASGLYVVRVSMGARVRIFRVIKL